MGSRSLAGKSDSSDPVDNFVSSAIIGNVALFCAIKGVTALDSDGGGGSGGGAQTLPLLRG
ncbi:hypothetical protein PSP31120_04447 [Pandoraea sputorum]|nr:hypothetical protein PSP31120_04447 [Pandoraea sputorum]